MKVLFSGVEISDDEEWVWKVYDYACVVCTQSAVCIHHEPPRSLNPGYKTDYQTWFPVCNSCHQLVHSISRLDAGYLLNSRRDEHFPNAVKELNERKP